MERSRSVRSLPASSCAALVFSSLIPILSEPTIVGIDLMTVIMPAAATAPAPMILMYPSQICFGDSSPTVVIAGSRPFDWR